MHEVRKPESRYINCTNNILHHPKWRASNIWGKGSSLSPWTAWTDKSEPPYPAADRLIIFAWPFCWRSGKIQHHFFVFAWGKWGNFEARGLIFPTGWSAKKKGNVSEMVEWGEWKFLAGSTTYSYTTEKVTNDKLAMSVVFWGYKEYTVICDQKSP